MEWNNSVNSQMGHAPPQSKGLGAKTYFYHSIFAFGSASGTGKAEENDPIQWRFAPNVLRP